MGGMNEEVERKRRKGRRKEGKEGRKEGKEGRKEGNTIIVRLL